jgi:hypothetical protein
MNSGYAKNDRFLRLLDFLDALLRVFCRAILVFIGTPKH